MPAVPLGLPEVGANSACSSTETVVRSQRRVLPWLPAQQPARSLHVEVLRQTEAERGRENRTAGGEGVPAAG